MQEIIEKIIERLEDWHNWYDDGLISVCGAIEIVNQVAEEYDECYKDCGECEAYDKEKHHCPKFCKVIKEAVEEIKENHSGWIPCNERLPEKNQKCLLQYNGSMSGNQDYMDVDIYNGERFEFFGIKNVIAWQPLPQPYQPKGE